jgi:glucan phosphoethanolaminetransferase (alkaline phosphatase superfamily)
MKKNLSTRITVIVLALAYLALCFQVLRLGNGSINDNQFIVTSLPLCSIMAITVFVNCFGVKKIIKPAQAWTIITGFLAIFYFAGRFEMLEQDRITLTEAYIGCIVSLLYIFVMKITYKALGKIDVN